MLLHELIHWFHELEVKGAEHEQEQIWESPRFRQHKQLQLLRGHCDPLQGVDEMLNDNENRVNPAIQGNIQDFQGQEDHL